MDQFRYYQNCQYSNTNNSRVYINRNFNRNGQESVNRLPNSNVMYLNPNFSNTSCSIQNILSQTDQAIRPKIHVNPNFIRSRTPQQEPINTDSQSNFIQPASSTASQTDIGFHPAYANKVKEIPVHTQITNVTKSRYSLVRQNENKPIKSPIVKTPSNTLQTVKVNKYKLVSLNSVKKNLIPDNNSSLKTKETKSSSNFIHSKYRIRLKAIPNNNQNTRFKFVKRNSITTILNSSETKQSKGRRVSITLNKSTQKTSFRPTKKIAKRALKKNNIPCPLFKKYGKCLRMTLGRCDYIHDKKHVSICRKFLKGICHDQQCPLSHDLTDKKMPTCYFYLQGNCTKEGCPYLHVKLNKNTKICPDFIKGYCEKGDKCLYRHDYDSASTSTKINTKKQNSYKHVKEKIYSEKTKKYRKSTMNIKALRVNVTTENKKCDESTGTEQRYFRDLADNTASAETTQHCDLIKPTRCKLGTLPSFIQL